MILRATDRGQRQIFEATRRVLYDSTSARAKMHPFRESNLAQFLICKSPVGGIAAVSGIAVSSQDCDVYQIDDDDDLVVYQEEGTTLQVKVYNPYSTAITAEKFITVGLEKASGRYLVISEDC